VAWASLGRVDIVAVAPGRIIASGHSKRVQPLEIGKVVMRVFSISANNGLRIPPELSLLGKALLNLDHVGRCLDPEFNASSSVRRHALPLVAQRMSQEPSPWKLLSRALGAKAFVEALPRRINRVFDAFDGEGMTVHLEGLSPEPILEGFRNIANRVTTGLILAALIIGASLLMRVQTDFTLFGYPGFAMICFLAAAAGGFGLVVSIFWTDWGNYQKKVATSR
jgi:predicted unusual protein kinase regulating ubiquinone biosynthesis (AarF/ABC1/UbiB family)